MDPAVWDSGLCSIPGAHPMQCWSWGEARRDLGDRVERIMVHQDGEPMLMAQIFLRRLPLGFPCGWVPRGPVVSRFAGKEVFRAFKSAARSRGFRLIVVHPYSASGAATPVLGFRFRQELERTFILDLDRPLDQLEKAFDKDWRYGKNRFAREGGVVIEDVTESGVLSLAEFYSGLVQRKGFRAYGGTDMMLAVFRRFRDFESANVRVHLFRAEVKGEPAGAILVLRAGNIGHYLWGAFEYKLRNSRVSEGLQWAAICRLRELGATLYDLEGASEKAPGVMEFKRKMGGLLITLPPKQACWSW
jgi:hypothetical protein